MDFAAATYVLGFLAGAASTLSPCVLPIIPVLVATAASQHALGTLAMAAGLSLSFAVTGTAIAAFGSFLGVDTGTLRDLAATSMVVFGLIMAIPPLQTAFTAGLSRLGGAGNGWLERVKGDGLAGQFLLGLVLGLVWTPCVGPTLGAAATLAAQGRDLGHIVLLMLVFGLGAGLPMLVIGGISRATLMRARGSLAGLGRLGRAVLGGVFVVLGVLALTGLDRHLEAALLAVSPDWLTRLTTSL